MATCKASGSGLCAVHLPSRTDLWVLSTLGDMEDGSGWTVSGEDCMDKICWAAPASTWVADPQLGQEAV